MRICVKGFDIKDNLYLYVTFYTSEILIVLGYVSYSMCFELTEIFGLMFCDVRRMHRFILCQNYIMFPLVL